MSDSDSNHYSKKLVTPRVASHASSTATATPGNNAAATPYTPAAAPTIASSTNHAAIVTDRGTVSTLSRHSSHDSGSNSCSNAHISIDGGRNHYYTPNRPMALALPLHDNRVSHSDHCEDSSETDEDHENLDQDQRRQLTQDMWQDDVDMDQILLEMRLSQEDGQDEASAPQEPVEPVTKRPRVDTRRGENHQSHKQQQPTMSQFYSYTKPAPAVSNNVNSDSTATTIPANGNLWRHSGRDFMVKDTWTSSAHKDLKHFYFCLSRRDSKDRQKAVIGPVHMHLEHTFIGREQAHKFIAHRRQRNNNLQQQRWNTTPQHHPHESLPTMMMSHPEMILYASKGHLLERGRLPLSVLTTRYACESMEGTIQTDLIYEKGGNSSPNSSDKIVTSGFTCAYTFAPNTSNIHSPALAATKSIESMETLELFAGCQGLGKGFSLEGLATTHAVELDRSACDTIRKNAPSTLTVWNEDARRWLKNCQDGRLAAYPKKGQFGFLHWSPPCQGSSNANRNGGMNDNANNSLTPFGVEVIRFFEPPFLTMEQVSGILNVSRGRREILQKTITDLLLLDYQVRLCVVNAAHYGDAQNRERVLLFGAKRGYKLPDFPKITHGDTSKGLLKLVTVQDALGRLEAIAPVPDNGLVELPGGQLVHDHCLNASPSEHKSNVCTLVADKPAPTVRRTNAIRHYNPHLDRLISIRESALLQGFPMDYTFCGDHKSVRDQIGNAVPVNLARAIARTVLAAATHHAQR